MSTNPFARPRNVRTDLGALTAQECRVAVLVGQALTNRQIARRLDISPHTVNYHLRQIFRKLAINSRICLAQAVVAHATMPDLSDVEG